MPQQKNKNSRTFKRKKKMKFNKYNVELSKEEITNYLIDKK